MDKNDGQTRSISALAQEYDTRPGAVHGVLYDLGLEFDGDHFSADEATFELVQGELLEHAGSQAIFLKHGVTLREVALGLGKAQAEVHKALMMKLKVMATLTTSLKDDVIEKLAGEFGSSVKWVESVKPKAVAKPAPGKKETTIIRPPVVTIMGHVDHGKTSLLDTIRKANVAAREHGGITQHIGAYQVALKSGVITFLDTPGHAAFTAMRARGASVTDIAILVVAADDGIMPQTIEAIQHAQNAKVPIIVAINKIDRPDANPDKVIQQLTEYGLIAEAFGGQTITCPVSAVTGEGVENLLEMILLQAEVLELKADPKAEFKGTVIEAKLEKGRGPVATLLVQEGTLSSGDALVVGNTYGKIKAMTDYQGERMADAGPSSPVEILGLSEVPLAGDVAERHSDERSARVVAEARVDEDRLKQLVAPTRSIALSDLQRILQHEEVKELNLIIKADVQGSVEAVKGMLEKVKNEEVSAKIILSGVGTITENDVLLASASNAIIVGFNVKPEGGAKREAERRKVEIRTYTIIYELIEDIEAAAKGMLEPKFEEQYLGTADVRLRLEFSKKGIIAGSYITDGKVTRNSEVRVSRGREVIFTGKVATLKHLKDDVREVTVGMECGITFEGWEDFKEGDTIEAFEMVQVNA